MDFWLTPTHDLSMKKIPRRVHVPVLPESLLERMRGPLAFVNMHPDEAMQWVQALGIELIGKMEVEGEQPTFFFFDDTRAMTLDHNLRELDIPAKTESKGDLWDLSAKQTLVWTPQRNDERELKLDIIEQAWHALKPGGLFLVWLPTKDLVGTVTMVHKTFGRIHEIPEGDNTLLWAQRTGERSKRRHELTFTAKIAKKGPFTFVGRPGVHCYGQIDEGTRSLAEIIEIDPGDRILDICCGAGAAGILAAQVAGSDGELVLADGSARVREVALHNAKLNGIEKVSTVSVEALEALPDESFRVILAHPPGFGTGALTERIIEEASRLLDAEGRFYLLTKQPKETAPMVVASFRRADALINRSYTVLVHNRAMPEGILSAFEDEQ
jgi:16S rRNA (guanine1207-N2)-methyltransferase